VRQTVERIILRGSNEEGLQDAGMVLDSFLHLFFIQEYRQTAKETSGLILCVKILE